MGPVGKGLLIITHMPPSEIFMAFPRCLIVILTSTLAETLFSGFIIYYIFVNKLFLVVIPYISNFERLIFFLWLLPVLRLE